MYAPEQLEDLANRTGNSLKFVKCLAGLVPDECLMDALIDPIYGNMRDYINRKELGK